MLGEVIWQAYSLSQVPHLPLLVILCLALFIVYRVLLYPKYFSPYRHIPGPLAFVFSSDLAKHFLYGPPLRANSPEGQDDGYNKFNDTNVIRIVGPLGLERLVLLSPLAWEHALITRWQDYPRPKFYRNAFKIVIGSGLLTTEGRDRVLMKKMIAPAFSLPSLVLRGSYAVYGVTMSRNIIKQQTVLLYSLIDVLTQRVLTLESPSSGVVLGIHEWMSKASLDMICSSAFSYDANALHNPHSELVVAFRNLEKLQGGLSIRLFLALSIIPGFGRFVSTKAAWRLRKMLGLIPFFGNASILVNTTKTRLLTCGEFPLFSLIKTTKFSTADILYQLNILGAGREGLESGLSWSLYFLAVNQDAQEKLRREVTPLLAKDPRPSYKALSALKWLDCVVMESLRLFPPSPGTYRQAEVPDHMDRIPIPKGTLVYFPFRIFNTCKSRWGNDAEKFRPERWLTLSESANARKSFAAFSFGPRACTGRTMAMIAMKVVLASLVAKFEFDLAYEGQLPRPITSISTKPKDNMPLRLRLVDQGAFSSK
ncbi:hypothetical protein NP233_g446 [Leucocoprinus birnbaumii]|uniref:Cytochrome P450 n=1 Tax=Leucocoprinus birnbaumii TaxID=56174 RepID=A0AAD5YVS8_9AGAR|nr:hypothetical protein NP233_g446 [Leucocoprinus birnbaumii]